MITKWRVANFKSIRKETELELGPLTIFAGANSSGKSTFIQSILLVAQTLAHKVGSRSVVLNGALANLGQFDDLKSSKERPDQISIKCSCRPRQERKSGRLQRNQVAPRRAVYYRPRTGLLHEIDCEISFDADPSSPEGELFQIQPRLFTTKLSCVYSDDEDTNRTAHMSIHHSHEAVSAIKNYEGSTEFDDHLRASLAYKVELDEDSMAEANEDYFSELKPIGCMLRHFLPERIVYTLNTIDEDAGEIISVLHGDYFNRIRPRHFVGRKTPLSEEVVEVVREVLGRKFNFDETFNNKDTRETRSGFSPDTPTLESWHEWLRGLPNEELRRVQEILLNRKDLSNRIRNAVKDSRTERSVTNAIVPIRPPRQLAEATLYLDSFFSTSLKYLGPLRDAPKPLYPLAPAADPNDVGLRGEHTASILELHKNKKIRYIPSDNFKEHEISAKIVPGTLEVAVVDWLHYLGVASSVKSRDKGKLGYELKVGLSNLDSKHDLTHVGVGVSQVLPILVMCLLADTDSTLVFEQPELHLHPKVQTLLGDFFLSMALCDKQCIVETHSEYFIDRLRYRIAAASPDEELRDKTKIYFVEKPSQWSVFQEVKINEYGAIPDWPEGFFDQSQQQAEEIVGAAAKKRKANRRNVDA